MPRFFFQISDGTNQPDPDPCELPDLNAARAQAVRFAGQLITDIGPQFLHDRDWQMAVTDETKLTLFTLVFAAYDAAAVSPN